MNCIIVNDDIQARNTIKTLFAQTENLRLIGSFDNTFDASKFMSENTVDVVFFDIQIEESNGIHFIKTIPNKVFVIYISIVTDKNYKLDLQKQFQKGVNEAQIYSENPNKTNDYFVI